MAEKPAFRDPNSPPQTRLPHAGGSGFRRYDTSTEQTEGVPIATLIGQNIGIKEHGSTFETQYGETCRIEFQFMGEDDEPGDTAHFVVSHGSTVCIQIQDGLKHGPFLCQITEERSKQGRTYRRLSDPI